MPGGVNARRTSLLPPAFRCYDADPVTTSSSPPALALVRGRLLPARADRADAILLARGAIRRIGATPDLLAAAPPDTAVLDLDGRTVVPGFVDGHAHFLQAGLRAARPDLSRAHSLDEALEIVGETLRAAPPSRVRVAEGWDETKWTRRTPPTREVLDALAPDRPLVLRRVCGHAAVANGAALGPLIAARGAHGIDAATGLLLEQAALELDASFRPAAEEIDAAIEAAGRRWLARGVTTTCDFLRGEMPLQYASFRARRTLPLRVVAYLVEEHGRIAAPQGPPPDDAFRPAGRKTFSDGSIGARTAALFAPYADRPRERGALLLEADAIAAACARAVDAGHALAVHAIGDRAIAAAIEAFARFPAETNRRLRHRIEHFELPRPGDAARLAELGVRPCMQPNFAAEWGGPGGLYEEALGAERVRTMNPLRSTLRAGCGLFFGSDGMPLSPLYGVSAALAHPNPEERLTVEESVALYTEAAADALVGDARFGRLEEGMAADVAVLPPHLDWTRVTAEDEVDLTIAGGRVAHRSARFDASPAAATRRERP